MILNEFFFLDRFRGWVFTVFAFVLFFVTKVAKAGQRAWHGTLKMKKKFTFCLPT